MKKIVFVLILLAGITSLQAQEGESHIRKGVHLGAHFTPGYGTIFTEAYEYLSLNFGMTAGMDMNIYFNDLMGIHTGLTYHSQPWRYRFSEDGNPVEPFDINARVTSIGIPVKFLLTTGQHVAGFYLEAGFAFYFPVDYTSDRDKNILKTSPAMFAPEFAAGVNLRASDVVSFNISGFSSTTMPVFNNLDAISVGVLYGVKMGVMFRLSK